jgi:hypothetical protein
VDTEAKRNIYGSSDIDSRFLPAGVGKRSAWWQACCRGGEAEINIYGSADIDSRFLLRRAGVGKRSAGSADIDSRFLPAGVGKRSAWWRACCRGGEAEINIYGSADIDSRFFPAGVGKRSAWWRACCLGGEAK